MRKRKTNKHLPDRVYIKCGSYYYVNQQAKWIKLGKTLADAMTKWATIVEPNSTNIESMSQIFDRYMLEIAPQKAPRTYQDNKKEIKNLYEAFAEMRPQDITPVHIYQYIDARAKKAKTRANREKALLSHVFSMSIRWGVLIDNPCKNVKRIPVKKRNHYITHDDYKQFYNFLPDDKKAWFTVAYYTGLRQGDILKIKLEEIQADGLFVEIGKTGERILIEWTPEFKRIIEIARLRAQSMNSIYLFPNESGQPYTSSGFQSNWQKLMKKALKEKIIDERFRFHDIRRKTATDIEQSKGREQARQLLGHSDQKTTGIYISGIHKVKPLM